MRLIDAIDAWVERLHSTHMESTISSYRESALKFEEWLRGGGEASTTDLNVVMLEDFDDHLRKNGIAMSSRQRSFYALSSLFSFLRRRGHQITEIEPASRPRGIVPRREPIPKDAISNIVTGEKDHMYKAFFSALAGTGARLGEILTLDADDVDLEQRTISIHGEKNSGIREIPLPPATMKILRDYIENHKRNANEGNPLFVTRVGSRLSERSARTGWKKALERIGKDGKFCMHQIRHRYGTDVVSNGGVDIGQAILGHKSPASTLRYCHPSMKKMRDVVENL